jgi:murein DD-endopeptidase MepM/ murein hydrolase activator NlpD
MRLFLAPSPHTLPRGERDEKASGHKLILVAIIILPIFVLSACTPVDGGGGRGGEVPVYHYGRTAGGGSLGMHTVQPGETLWAISQKYHLDLRDVLDRNHLSPPYALHAGTRLSLPAPTTYRVRSGDTLYKVSRLFDASLTDLVRLNQLKAPYKIAPGQTLTLPVRHRMEKIVAVRPDIETTAVGLRPSSRIEREELPPTQMAAVAGRNQMPQPEIQAQPKIETPVSAEKIVMPQATPAREGRFLRPVGGKVVSSFGPKKDGLHNDGINIRAAKGDGVRAAENGVVVYADDQMEGYGNLVLVRHGDGYVTAYAHLDKMLVGKGNTVKRGQIIGTVGTTGHVSSPQLHFEIRKGTKALDPTSLIGG